MHYFCLSSFDLFSSFLTHTNRAPTNKQINSKIKVRAHGASVLVTDI